MGSARWVLAGRNRSAMGAARELLRSSKATCLIQIPREQIEEFARTTM
jgi:hypothetical protein